MALKFPNHSHRVGTIKDSVYGISSIAEYIKDSGKATVQSFGPSSDGKSNYEWRIIPKNGMEPFAVYDYKFGLDPGDEDNFQEEFEFSIGGQNPQAVESAKAFGFSVVPGQTMEAYHVGNDKEVITKEEELNEAFVRQMKYKAGIIK